jgi:hypothetical protein
MSESIEQIREKAAVIVDRIKTDSAFKAQVEQDPENALISAGLSANAVSDFLTNIRTETGEVSGYLDPTCTISCICTGCCLTI